MDEGCIQSKTFASSSAASEQMTVSRVMELWRRKLTVCGSQKSFRSTRGVRTLVSLSQKAIVSPMKDVMFESSR